MPYYHTWYALQLGKNMSFCQRILLSVEENGYTLRCISVIFIDILNIKRKEN